MELVEIARRLRRDVTRLEFAPPVTHIYNPLDYAWKPHRVYLERYGRGKPHVILLGMNPEYVVGVGRFAADRAAAVLEGMQVNLGVVPQPSPASPAANRGWAAQATRALVELGITA